MRRHRPARSTLVALVLAAAPFGAACSKPPAPAAEAAAPIGVAALAVAEIDWPAQFDAGGVLQARTTAVIASRIMAPVVAVRVRPGDRVTRGQLLVELDGASLTAVAARAAAEAGAARDGVAAAEADVHAASAALTLAKATHTRIADLAATRAATTQELDEAAAALAAADSRVNAAEARRRQAVAARLAADAGQHAAESDAAYLRLTAPFDGLIASRAVDPGSMAAPGVPLLVLEGAAALQFEARLDAARTAAIIVGQTVDVRIDTDSASAAPVAGRVAEISRIDADVHRFGVKIDIAPAPGWRAGLFGRARFTGAPRRTVAIPATAVVKRGQLAFVFVAADGRAHLRAVSLGESSGSNVEVLDGLVSGERILAAPPATLVDGAHVTIAGGAR